MLNFDPERFQLEDLDKVLEQSRQLVERIEEAQDRLPEIQGVGETANGQVKAIANGQGRLERIELNPRAMRMDSQTLAEQVTAAVQAAQDDAQRQINEVLGEAMGGTGFDPQSLDQDKLRAQFENLADSFGRDMDRRANDVVQRARKAQD